jgi:hypothetical protein
MYVPMEDSLPTIVIAGGAQRLIFDRAIIVGVSI